MLSFWVKLLCRRFIPIGLRGTHRFFDVYILDEDAFLPSCDNIFDGWNLSSGNA